MNDKTSKDALDESFEPQGDTGQRDPQLSANIKPVFDNDDEQLSRNEDGADPMADWASALAEQNAPAINPHSNQATGLAEQDPKADPKQNTSVFNEPKPVFQRLGGDPGERVNLDIDALKDIPVQLSVELGRTRLTIRELLQLGQGSVVDLTGLAGEPLDVFINGHLIAQGEVVVVDENYGVRLTDILTPSDRLQRLSGAK